jgi:hypothetical protein
MAIGSGFATNEVQFRLTNIQNTTVSKTIVGASDQDYYSQVIPSFNITGYLIELSKDNFVSITGSTIADVDLPFMHDLRVPITAMPTLAPTTTAPSTATPTSTPTPSPTKQHKALDINYIMSTGNNILLSGSGFETNDIFVRITNVTNTVIVEPDIWSDSTAESVVSFSLVGSFLEIANVTSFSTIATSTNVSTVPFIFYTKTRPTTATPVPTTSAPTSTAVLTSQTPTTTTHTPTPAPTTPTPTLVKQPFVIDYITSAGNSIVSIGSGFLTNDVYVRVKNSTDTTIVKSTVWSDSTAEAFVGIPLVGTSIEISNYSNFASTPASVTVGSAVPFAFDVRATVTPTTTSSPTTRSPTTTAPTTTVAPTTIAPTTTATPSPTTRIPTSTVSPTTTPAPTTPTPTPTRIKRSKPFAVHSITSTGDSILTIGAGFLTNNVYLKLTNATDTVVKQAVSLSDTAAEADLESTMMGFSVDISNDTSFTNIAASAFINTTAPFVVDAHAPPGWVAGVPICKGIPATDPDVCNGVGVCTSDNTCVCGKLYSGAYCEDYNCFGVSHTDPTVCNGVGQCVGLDNCSCTGTGKYGHNCLFPLCYGIKMEDVNVCNGHGFCTDTDTCKCSYGWSKQLCNVPVCFNFTADDPNVCWGRGSCIGPDLCSCISPYTGSKCKSPSMRVNNISPSVVVNGGNINITGSGFVQTTGTISCQYWIADGIEYDLVSATIVSETEASCVVNIEAATNDIINVKLIRDGASDDDSDPSNTDVFTIINSVLTSTDCGQVPGSTGCPNVTVAENGNLIVAAALEEGRRSLQSTAKSSVLDMQGYVDFTISDLKGSHGSPIEFWFFDETALPSTYTAIEVGNKISLFFDNMGGGTYFDRVQEKCVFAVNTKYRMVLKLYKSDSIYIINSTLYTMPEKTPVCTIEQIPRSFNPTTFFAQNYSLVLSASSNSEQQAVQGAADSSVQLAVDVMVFECQPGKCKVNSGPLTTVLTAAPEPFPWIAVVIPAVVIILLIAIVIVIIIASVSIYMRKNVYINEEIIDPIHDLDDDLDDFNIEDEEDTSSQQVFQKTKSYTPQRRQF